MSDNNNIIVLERKPIDWITFSSLKTLVGALKSIQSHRVYHNSKVRLTVDLTPTTEHTIEPHFCIYSLVGELWVKATDKCYPFTSEGYEDAKNEVIKVTDSYCSFLLDEYYTDITDKVSSIDEILVRD